MIKLKRAPFLLIAGTAAFLAACDNKGASDPVPKLQTDPAAIERGKEIFAGTCGAYCHKMTDAQSDAPNLFDCTWLHGGSDQEIFNTISHGVPKTRMVPFADALPDEDIWKIVAYLKAQSKCPQ